jgi:hypothetical protein
VGRGGGFGGDAVADLVSSFAHFDDPKLMADWWDSSVNVNQESTTQLFPSASHFTLPPDHAVLGESMALGVTDRRAGFAFTRAKHPPDNTH